MPSTTGNRRLRTPVRHDGVDEMSTGRPARAVEERAAVHADTRFAQCLGHTLRGIVDR
ncbi:hypothetical protein [Kocuria arenosa]|uniref:hypothetical protein n=1 Tax=Kocuria arenosa TaxID=3071446 RepID=UPI0034D78764